MNIHIANNGLVIIHNLLYQLEKVFNMRNMNEVQIQPIIGQAWTGKHVILLHCTNNNQFLQLYKSYHAPIEPPRHNCAETLSQLLSIGYSVAAITPISSNQIQYVLVL
ncbi:MULTISPECIES: hypothetical protein [Neobacillus]|nr:MULTISPECIES: hypothetical protein [Neobacillus]